MNHYTLEYWYGSYHGEHKVWADDSEQAIAKMWAEFRRKGYMTLGMATKGAKVLRVVEGAAV